MLKLIIIDDEEITRKAIANIIDWKSNGIEVVGDAENGNEALRLIEELSPDILLIDIRMPVMSGLQVLEHLNSIKCSIPSIILSGYDDFAYAQKAIKLGAMDYLLKPCKPKEILQAVQKVKSIIECEIEKDERFRQLKAQFNQSLPLLKEKYLNKLILANSKAIDNLNEKFNLYNINLEFYDYIVILVRIDDFFNFSIERTNEEVELMKFAIRNITSELIGENHNCEVFESVEDIVAIVNCKDDISGILDTIKYNIKRFFGFTVTIGVGNRHTDISELYLSYNEAVKSLEAKFLLGSDIIIKYSDIHNENKSNYFYPLSDEKDIINAIQSSNREEININISTFFSKLENKNADKDYFVKSSIALALSAYHFCIEKDIETNIVFGEGFTFFNQLQKLDTLVQLKAKIIDIMMKIHELLNEKKGGNKLIEIAIKYIEENYYKDLNLDSVAREIYITSGYFSLLFKQITGTNFVDFLHKTRIKKACDILKNFSLKTYEAALKVGYNDEKYFSQIFRKYTGVTPTQYRNNIKI